MYVHVKRHSELQTVVDKGRDRGASTLVACCTEVAGLLGRDTEENRYVVISRCLGRQLEVKSIHDAKIKQPRLPRPEFRPSLIYTYRFHEIVTAVVRDRARRSWAETQGLCMVALVVCFCPKCDATADNQGEHAEPLCLCPRTPRRGLAPFPRPFVACKNSEQRTT
ncbi:hypothetical protein Y032_0540g3155 [Ancylostoma ceylanicum]|uniref:Uncharacterized protein n=1 Tax=Ancylostoma ceylanicum TaxID=53326 RepID=A0A016WSC4_9BILA|nr:hypothetical protein Y032_0540g3155 [Ancylostoma ceylanicum]